MDDPNRMFTEKLKGLIGELVLKLATAEAVIAQLEAEKAAQVAQQESSPRAGVALFAGGVTESR